MLGSIGDLVEDVVVRLHEQVNVASDTQATVIRRRGGSAANVAAAACASGAAARFIGQVGDDATGHTVTAALEAEGVDVVVRRAGRTGTIVVLVDVSGERTMLSDRAACTMLDEPSPQWLDGLHTLHIPYYSLTTEPLAGTTTTLAAWATARGITVSVDVSSAAVLQHVGPRRALARIAALRPGVVLANELEAATIGDGLRPDQLGGSLVVVKQGPDPAIVWAAGRDPVRIPAVAIPDVHDTTGAGDAFAAGLLTALAAGADHVEATRRAHEVAANAVRRASFSDGAAVQR